MSDVSIGGAALGNALMSLLAAGDIEPGDAPSYQTCKTIYAYHPLGGKLADFPIAMAQSQPRNISVKNGPEERLREAFEAEWKALGADRHIFNCARLARVYGVASIGLLCEGTPLDRPVNFQELYRTTIGFNVLDPLNTAGSLVLNQNPNAMDFQKVNSVSVSGQAYHRSRTVTALNEDPVYIEYTTSAFGYVGRSVYQRALYQLKSFISTLITDDMIALKAGVLVAKTKQQSSAIDALMASVGGAKRALLKEAQTGQVLQIGSEDDIVSLDLTNMDGAYGMARKNIIENIASAAGTPAKLLLSETFAEGFGEGTEDAKHVAQYIDRIREWMQPLYGYFDKICRYRAWNPDFYKTIQNDFPEDFAKVGYTQAFYDWSNSFKAAWPNLLEEPDSEKIKVDDVRLKAVIAMCEVLLPEVDPENKASVIQWALDNFNSLSLLFPVPLQLDMEALREYEPPAADSLQEPEPGRPFAAADSMARLGEAVARLPLRSRGRA